MTDEYYIRLGHFYSDEPLSQKEAEADGLAPSAPREAPYEGAKDMLLVEQLDDRDFLAALFRAMYDELPAPKPKKK